MFRKHTWTKVYVKNLFDRFDTAAKFALRNSYK